MARKSNLTVRKHALKGGGFERATVVTVEHELIAHRVDVFGQRGALEQTYSVICVAISQGRSLR